MAGNHSVTLLFLLLSVVAVTTVLSQSSHVCTVLRCRYVQRRTCRYYWWFSCCSYRYYRVPEYYYNRECCYGWRDAPNSPRLSCNEAICNPPCENGGTCTRPGVCSCRAGYSGYRCKAETCNHERPCYPGSCLTGGNCDCSSGFTSDSAIRTEQCLKVEEDRRDPQPQIYEMQVRLSYVAHFKNPPMTLHEFITDSSDPELSQADFIWTNRRDFNKLETTCASQYFPPEITGKPDYVTATALGIVQGNMTVYLNKLGPGGTAPTFISLNDTIPCTQTVSPSQPATGLFNCSISRTRFDRILEHRDVLRVTFSTKAGGFRDLTDLTPSASFYQKQYFDGPTQTKSVEFKFDFQRPYHCAEPGRGFCSDPKSMLNVPDFTRSRHIQISWDHWQDDDSGMYRYAWEVFKMTKAAGTELEIKPTLSLKPLINQEVFHANYTPQSYSLPEPGMYSVILEAGDEANNTKYVRRLVLYDPDPTITTDPDNDFFFTSASAAANYTFQNSTSLPVKVTWDRHFRNALHEDNNLLGRVREYPPSLEDLTVDKKYIFRKVILRNQTEDDWEGNRTVQPIPNSRGIVKFHIKHTKDTLGRGNRALPGGPWTDLGLNTNYTLGYTPTEKETVTVWVKATDKMGTEKIEQRQLSFDDTPPSADSLRFHMNHQVPGIDFSSVFTLNAADLGSGVAFVEWTFRRNSSQEILYHESVPGKRLASCSESDSSCYTSAAGDAFARNQSFAVSNCRMTVEKENLNSEVILVTADVTNMAGLKYRLNMTKDDLTKLNGTQAYFPPQNITAVGLSSESCTVTWSFPPSCFERTALEVIVGEGRRVPVHKDAEEFTVPGLEPGTEYTLYMKTYYEGNEESNRAPFKCVTAEADGLSAGGIAGIIIGFIIIALLVVLIVIFVLWKRGRIFQREGTTVNRQLHRVSRAFDNVRKTVRREPGAHTNTAYKAGEDEIYVYGAMAFNTRQAWQLSDSSLTLMDHIVDGKFASIYKATWRHEGRQDIVAAKMLKTGYTEDDAMKMMAKINFFATQLEDHDNVIRFIGAVTDNQGWGPVLVMEYCEQGQMDQWLTKRRGRVNEEVMENLFRFALGIAKGMEYLTSKKVVHKRLAARNVLLTFTLETKVAGFGPQKKEGEEDKATRIPAKWAAPEVLQDKPPTEKSDVWSYGVVLWEIFSMGQVPYPNVHSNEIGTRLRSGYRMEKPEFADDTYYTLMKDCWQYKPAKRPTFTTIKAQLARQFSSPGNRQSVNFYYDTKELQD